MKRRATWIASTLLLFASACRQDMYDQPRYKPLAASPLFANGAAARPRIPGTVERGHTAHERAFYTGTSSAQALRLAAVEQSAPPSLPLPTDPDKPQLAAWRAITAAGAAGGAESRQEESFTDSLPETLGPLSEALLLRGRERFEIFCAVCHDRTGSGNGMLVQRGFTRPPSFHSERLRQARLGHFFDVISSGFGAMPSLASQLRPADRWAVVAYIRALQLSQHAHLEELPPAAQQAITSAGQEGAR